MKSILYLLLCTSFLGASELKLENKSFKVQRDAIFAPEKLGTIDIIRNKKGFHVLQEGKKYKVKGYLTDPLLKTLPREKLNAFLDNGYIAVKQLSDGEFKLEAKGRLKGGGPFLAGIAYWGVKAVGYGVPAAAAGAAVVAAGAAVVPVLAVGGAGGLAGGATMATTTAVTYGIGAALPASATLAGSIAGQAVIGTIGVEATSLVAGGAIAGAGGAAGYVATVEAAAAGLAGLAMLVPFL